MDPDFKSGRQQRLTRSIRKALDARSAPTSTSGTETETFRTPEEVAADDTVDFRIDMNMKPEAPASKKSSWRDKFKFKWPPNRKEWLTSLAIILVCGSIVGFVLTRVGDKPVTSATAKTAPKAPPKPTTVPSTLSGLPVAPETNQRPVTGVMIENSLAARPQSGLSEAGVVFEAIAEGGITRFLALYQDTAPGDVGPIRSARPYYINWLMGFDAGYAHVGGSPEALAAIPAKGVKDLDQFRNAGSYHRVSYRAAPHNVYTGIETLVQLQISKGYTSSTYSGFARKKAAPTKEPPTARVIDVSISGPTYNVRYDYNAPTNSYNRSMGGGPHIDANGNKQISPTTVVVLVMPYGLNGKYSVYQNIGSGQVFIFQDGVVSQGTWAKANEKSQITFADAAGKPLKLNPGQTWVTAVGAPTSVTFSP